MGLEVPTTDDGAHRSRRRLDRGKGGGELALGVGQDFVDRFFCRRRHVTVERGDDLEAALEYGVVALLGGLTETAVVEQRLLDLLDEVVVRLLLQTLDALRQRTGECALGGRGADNAGAHKPVGHDAAPFLRPLGKANRVVADRIPDQASEEDRVANIELRRLLAEVDLGGRLHAVGAVAEVHGVEVALEDLVLRVVVLDPPRQQCLAHLAVDRFLRRQQRVLDQLLRDRRAALPDVTRRDVGGERAHGAAQVDAVVLPEAIVLDAEHGVDHDFRDLRQLHRLAVLVGVQHGERAAVAPLDHGALAQFAHLGESFSGLGRPGACEGARARDENHES